ncbi:glycosyltransferase family 4 protein [Candidatus Dependentiae bacterium]|nr:glycosyltransferase family 4 protein [Candidatus Dependentiae bacterium]
MKKILFIHHGKGLGGAPLSLLYLVESLDTTKYTPIVLFLHHSEVIELFKERGIQTVGPVNVYDFAHTKIWWFGWRHAHHLARAIKDTIKTMLFIAPKILAHIKPDLVHLNTSSLLGWGITARKKNIPLVWHIREPLASGYFGIRKKIVQQTVKRYADAIVPICKHDATPWAHNKKTHVVYNAVHEKYFNEKSDVTSFFASHGVPKDDPKILFVGGLSKEKGTLEILKIFQKVLIKIPNAKLLLAGYLHKQALSWKQLIHRIYPASNYAHQIHVLLEELGSSVIQLGSIRNIPAAMTASNVIVFPATVGHFARPIIEAGFMKRPVVVSALAPLDELVIDDKTGFLVAINNHQLWAEKLCLLLTDKLLAQRMGNAAYAFCREKFSLPEQVQKIEKIYTELLTKESHE